VTKKTGLHVSSFTVADAIENMNVNRSDGRYKVDGTWQDKLRIYEDSYTLGEIRAGHERDDLKKVPRGTKCYATYLPSLQVIRWANSQKIEEALGGTRHDFVNRGDALEETDPRRGYLQVAEDGSVTVSTG
jgi:hypothetical protein